MAMHGRRAPTFVSFACAVVHFRYEADGLSSNLAAKLSSFDAEMDALESRGLPLPPVPDFPIHNHHKEPRVVEVPDPELDDDDDEAVSSDDESDYAPEHDDSNPYARTNTAATAKKTKQQQQKKKKASTAKQRNVVRVAPKAIKRPVRSTRNK